jgi:hypothetical protein
LGDWVAGGRGGGGRLVAVALLIFIRMLILLTVDLYSATKIFGCIQILDIKDTPLAQGGA